jgi:glutamine synthetase type III
MEPRYRYVTIAAAEDDARLSEQPALTAIIVVELAGDHLTALENLNADEQEQEESAASLKCALLLMANLYPDLPCHAQTRNVLSGKLTDESENLTILDDGTRTWSLLSNRFR